MDFGTSSLPTHVSRTFIRWIVLFVVTMLQIGVWTKFCPSKFLFEKLGLKKSEL